MANILTSTSKARQQGFVQTNAPKEEIFGLNADHRRLGNIETKGESFGMIYSFIHTALEDAL